MTTLKQNDRERAQFALDVIKNFKKKELRTIALKFPAMVVNNGLGQTIAFLLSEGTKESKVDKNKADGYFYSMIQKWLCEKVKIYDTPVEKEESDKKLMERLIGNDSPLYIRATKEILSLSIWLKRFAEALIEKEES